MNKQVIFFTEKPPEDRTAIHICLSKTELPHEQVLRYRVSQYLGSSAFQLATSPNGKLYLMDTQLHFNLSDCKEWLAIAFSWEAPVGIDIEEIYPIEKREQLIMDCFAAQEKEYVHSAKNQDEALLRFWEIWNRKEACFKALGQGLQDKMDEWDCAGNDWVFVKGVWVRSVPLEPPLSAAVAIVV